ncbi:calmodulin [Neurospora intermedia]|uniref:Calmodulin n=1 Tax=Neurospora intermedia TaxID=5142 RepID=A0ABR3DL64_NEUIN
MATPTAGPYKPSPLGSYASPMGSAPLGAPTTTRNSPFQRKAVSPVSPSPLRQAATSPLATPPVKQQQQSLSGGGSSVSELTSRFANNIANSSGQPTALRAGFGAPAPTTATPTSQTQSQASWTPRASASAPTVVNLPRPNPMFLNGDAPPPRPPQHRISPLLSPSIPRTTTSASTMSMGTGGNAMSQLQPSQVRTLREGFQILDRDSDGMVVREDVIDMLNQLGLPNSASDVSPFFPPNGPQSMTMAVFFNSIATALSSLSPSGELLSAFSAFDDDDSGQIDVAELRDALLNTAPEPGERPLTSLEVDKVMAGFTGRRAFAQNSQRTTGLGGVGGGGANKRGEVFRYQEFVKLIQGTGNGGEQGSEDSGRG